MLSVTDNLYIYILNSTNCKEKKSHQDTKKKSQLVPSSKLKLCCLKWSFLTLYHEFTELLDDILREKPQEADGIDSVVVVDNVPQVGPERLEKLKNVIHKIFSKFGKITTEFYPEADGLTKGYVWPRTPVCVLLQCLVNYTLYIRT